MFEKCPCSLPPSGLGVMVMSASGRLISDDNMRVCMGVGLGVSFPVALKVVTRCPQEPRNSSAIPTQIITVRNLAIFIWSFLYAQQCTVSFLRRSISPRSSHFSRTSSLLAFPPVPFALASPPAPLTLAGPLCSSMSSVDFTRAGHPGSMRYMRIIFSRSLISVSNLIL